MKTVTKFRKRAAMSPEAGVTLVEMIIAIVVLTVGLVALAQLFVVATMGNSYAVTTSGGVNDAQRLIEAWKIRAATTAITDPAITSATHNGSTCAAFAALTGYNSAESQYKENVWVFDWNGNLVGSASPSYPPGVTAGTLRAASEKTRLIYIRMEPKSPDPRTNTVVELSAMIAGK